MKTENSDMWAHHFMSFPLECVIKSAIKMYLKRVVCKFVPNLLWHGMLCTLMFVMPTKSSYGLLL